MNSLISKFLTVWTKPMTAMQAVKDEGEDASIKSAMIFVVVMGVLSGVITAIMNMIFPPEVIPGGKAALWLAAVIVPIISLIGSFIAAFILWGPLVFGLVRGSLAQYKTSYRLLALLSAFSPVSSLLSPIPVVGQYIGIAINIWAIIVMVRGVIIVMDAPVVRTWVLLGLIFGVMFIMGLVFRAATQRQLEAGGVGFPGTADFGDGSDFGFTDDELKQQLEELAREARENK